MPPFLKRVLLVGLIAAAGGVVLSGVYGGSRAALPGPIVAAPTPATESGAVPTREAAAASSPRQPDRFSELQQRLVENPNDTGAISQVADMYMAAKRYPQAADLYARAVEIAPEDAELRTGYGIALFYAGLQSLGQRELKKALDLNPDNPEAHFNYALAISHGANADHEAAARSWREVIRLAPNSALAEDAQRMLEPAPLNGEPPSQPRGDKADASQ
jgi:cytochrome c-type biogenesis protein CcmH/NrfG